MKFSEHQGREYRGSSSPSCNHGNEGKLRGGVTCVPPSRLLGGYHGYVLNRVAETDTGLG